MKATRTALLAMLLCLLAAASRAQTATSSGGDLGLFTIPTAHSPLAGTLTLGTYAWKYQMMAGDFNGFGIPQAFRLYNQWGGEASLGLGITDHWSIFVSGGVTRWESRGGWQGGTINGVPFPDPFVSDQASKFRIGSKYVFTSVDAPGLGIGIWLSAYIPVGESTNSNKIYSNRTDWEWGGVITKDIFTGMVSYQLSGQQDQVVRVPNKLRFAIGVDLPILPDLLHVISEIDRNIYDGGDFSQPSYSMFTAGARFWFGKSGFSVSTALNLNIDEVAHFGWGPSPLGGVVGVSYAAWPPAPPAPVAQPRPAPPTPAPVEEERKESEAKPAPVPAVAPVAPPPPTPKTTRDEIFFDGTSARLTNIAKAILDGIALRMKSDLNSTAVITGYTDNSGKEGANLGISEKRANAAKEYLVTRHGIDPNRLSTVARGSAEPAYDNATKEGREKNRRAVIVVTFVSGA